MVSREILSIVGAKAKRARAGPARGGRKWGPFAVGSLASSAALAACLAPIVAPHRGAGAAGAAGHASAPDVVLVVIDTLRRDALGCYGAKRGASPRLDQLAAASVVFENCLAPSSWTEPSTASLLSGLYPARHGCHEYARLPEGIELLSERLRAAGWRTLAVSGNLNASPSFGFDQGFDAFHFDGSDQAREYEDVAELVAHAERLLGEGDDGRPTFLWLQVMNVHGPYVAPDALRDRFRTAGAQEFPFQNEVWKDVMRKGDLARRAEATPARVADLADRYTAALAWTDEVLGGFFARRDARAGRRPELRIVTSDHGEELFDRGGFGHGFTLQREVVDVPLIVRLPDGAQAGRRVAAPVSLVDVPATVLDLLGLLDGEAGAGVGDGLSLVPLTSGGHLERDAPIVAQLERDRQGSAFLIQAWPWRLIRTAHDYAGRSDVVELFDLERDPAAARDASGDDAPRTASLLRLLELRRASLEERGLSAGAADLSDEQRRRLEELGYGQAGAR